MSTLVLYFGRWGGPGSGHGLYYPDGTSAYSEPISRHQLDAYYAGDHGRTWGWLDGVHGKGSVPRWKPDDQPEGLARMHNVDGWTIMAFWDRSGDPRYGSNSAFLAQGEHTFDGMVALAAEHFPGVWKRIAAAFDVRRSP